MSKSKNIGATVKRLFEYIAKRRKGLFITACICTVISALANVFGSMFLQVLVDQYISPMLLESNPVFGPLLHAVLIMAFIYLMGVIATFIYSRIMVFISQGSLKEIRDDMFTHMQSLPVSYFDQNSSGDIMSHYTNDTDTLRQFICQALPLVCSCTVTVIASFVIMVYYSWRLALVVVAISIVSFIITKKVAGTSAKYFGKQQKALGSLNGYIEEMLSGQKVVKVFCYESESKESFVEYNDQLFNDARLANRYSNILMPILGQIGNLQYVLLAFIGGYMVLSGSSTLSAGVIVAFLGLSRSFSMPIQQIAQQVNLIAMAMAGSTRIFELIDEEVEVNDGYVTLVNVKEDAMGELTETTERTDKWAWKHPHNEEGTVTYTPLLGDIRMENMDFSYVPDKKILQNVTLFAEPGQKLAFVGATGAGKTTITNLLNRFYDIDSGKIRYDGINISKIKKEDLRKSLGIVLQDTHLFTDTVMENIRYGRLDASDEECIEAAKIANADHFISSLPNGHNTELHRAGEGLSQGQRQLIAIARAAVADPPAMILDEATSSIDTRTEKVVQQGMDALMDGRTTFVIAHRLSTIQNSDAIMVLEKGEIIERGDHDSLIEKQGVYYQLYTGAFELE